MTRVLIGIPVRVASTRFPGKPLCRIAGISMVEHCFRRATLASGVDEVFVACCDEEVAEHVRNFGGRAIMTDPQISRPSLRVEAAAQQIPHAEDDIIVVFQGDEPLIHPKMIDFAIQPLLSNADLEISNLCAPVDMKDWTDPAEIKVVCDLDMNAMYMSRAPIPSIDHEEVRASWWRQVCVMPFRSSMLTRMSHGMEPTNLELQESIEMLRPMQHGIRVRMVPTEYQSKSVDTEHDRFKAESLMLADSVFQLYRSHQ